MSMRVHEPAKVAMHVTGCFKQKVFHGVTAKDAYLKACKWFASNVIAKDKMHGIQVEFVKDHNKPKVTLLLYATVSECEIRDQHCKCCEEMHNAFFISQKTNCYSCAAGGYQRRLEEAVRQKSSYYREVLNKVEGVEGDQADE